MEHKRIIPVLISLLTVSCLVLGLILFSLNRKNNYLPNESIESLVTILEADGIKIDPEIISPKVEHGTVYLSASEDYQKTVATLIGGDHVKATYGTPEGQIMIMESGAKSSSEMPIKLNFIILTPCYLYFICPMLLMYADNRCNKESYRCRYV